MKQIHRLIMAVLLLTLIAGCGGGDDKGKNKDKDIPKASEPQK